MTYSTLAAETGIGRVHLKVADLDHAVRRYRDALGFDLKRLGTHAAGERLAGWLVSG